MRLSMQQSTVPLSVVSSGERVKVSGIAGGANARKKLLDLGIRPGEMIEVISGHKNHPFLVRVGDSRVMIGWGMVEKVLVDRN